MREAQQDRLAIGRRGSSGAVDVSVVATPGDRPQIKASTPIAHRLPGDHWHRVPVPGGPQLTGHKRSGIPLVVVADDHRGAAEQPGIAIDALRPLARVRAVGADSDAPGGGGVRRDASIGERHHRDQEEKRDRDRGHPPFDHRSGDIERRRSLSVWNSGELIALRRAASADSELSTLASTV